MASSLPLPGSTHVKSDTGTKSKLYPKKNPSSKRFDKRKNSRQKVLNDIWVSPLSNFKEKVTEAKSQLLATGQISVNAVGPSIPHVINLALILQRAHNVAIETSTYTYFQNVGINHQFLFKMFFTMKEITKWLGITVFEILIWLLSLIVTCVLVLLRVEWHFLEGWSWWFIVGPIFFADLLNAYFCVIVFIRMYISGELKPAALRVLWSVFILGLGFVFKFLLCRKLESQSRSGLDFSAVLAPVFILIQLIILRACNMN